jgi:hypothetical protein
MAWEVEEGQERIGCGVQTSSCLLHETRAEWGALHHRRLQIRWLLHEQKVAVRAGHADKEWELRHHLPGPQHQTHYAPGDCNRKGGETAAGTKQSDHAKRCIAWHNYRGGQCDQTNIYTNKCNCGELQSQTLPIAPHALRQRSSPR